MEKTVNEPLSLRKVSCVLGIDREVLSRWIRNGTCPFGEYVPPENDASSGYYYVSAERLKIYITGADMLSSPCPYLKVIPNDDAGNSSAGYGKC